MKRLTLIFPEKYLPFIVTDLKEKQSEESLTPLISRTLAWSKKNLIAFRMGSPLKAETVHFKSL